MIENIFEDRIAENFPGKDIQVQGAQRVKMDRFKGDQSKTHYNLNGKIKDKERLLKAAREKQ